MSQQRLALVTGGAGFIGSHLSLRLLAEGWSVRVLDNFSSGRSENLASAGDEIDLLRGDIRDADSVARAVRGADVVFHEAAIPSVPQSIADPLETDDVNTRGTLRVLEAAHAAGVRRVVFASSCAIYGDSEEIPKQEGMAPAPLSPYALQKLTAETYCRLFAQLRGLETVALRYFNVFGPRQNPDSEYAAAIPRFIRASLKGESPRIFGDGEQTRDFVYVDDVVSANILAATATEAVGTFVNVASGRETSLNQLIATIAELTGCSAVPVHEAARAGDVRVSLASLDRATSALGYAPMIELREGLRRTMESMENSAGGQRG